MFHLGISRVQYANVSATSRSDGFGGKMYVPRAMYSLRMSFWIVPLSRSPGDPVLLRDQLVEQQQDAARRVDRHRRGDLVQRDVAEQPAHVLDRVDRHADLADLAARDRVVRVVPHLGRQVERDRQAHRAGREQLPVAGVGLGGGAEAGVLAHGPRTGRVHGRVDAARERVRTGSPIRSSRSAGRSAGSVHRLDRKAGFADAASDSVVMIAC